MRRYNRDERRYDRDEPSGAGTESSKRRRFPWDDPAADPAVAGDPAPEWTEPPIDPDPGSPEALEEARTESVPEDVGAGGPVASDAPEEFPWQESAGTDQPSPQPSPVWEEQPADDSTSVGTSGATSARGDKRNPMAIAGFVCSIVMWIPLPFVNVVLWAAAVTLSSIGLSRARRLGLPYKGLAIAGLCISLIGIVFIVFVILFFVGGIAFSD